MSCFLTYFYFAWKVIWYLNVNEKEQLRNYEGKNKESYDDDDDDLTKNIWKHMTAKDEKKSMITLMSIKKKIWSITRKKKERKLCMITLGGTKKTFENTGQQQKKTKRDNHNVAKKKKTVEEIQEKRKESCAWWPWWWTKRTFKNRATVQKKKTKI